MTPIVMSHGHQLLDADGFGTYHPTGPHPPHAFPGSQVKYTRLWRDRAGDFIAAEEPSTNVIQEIPNPIGTC